LLSSAAVVKAAEGMLLGWFDGLGLEGEFRIGLVFRTGVRVCQPVVNKAVHVPTVVVSRRNRRAMSRQSPGIQVFDQLMHHVRAETD
jgi:hypothetical protein